MGLSYAAAGGVSRPSTAQPSRGENMQTCRAPLQHDDRPCTAGRSASGVFDATLFLFSKSRRESRKAILGSKNSWPTQGSSPETPTHQTGTNYPDQLRCRPRLPYSRCGEGRNAIRRYTAPQGPATRIRPRTLAPSLFGAIADWSDFLLGRQILESVQRICRAGR